MGKGKGSLILLDDFDGFHDLLFRCRPVVYDFTRRYLPGLGSHGGVGRNLLVTILLDPVLDSDGSISSFQFEILVGLGTSLHGRSRGRRRHHGLFGIPLSLSQSIVALPARNRVTHCISSYGHASSIQYL